MKVTSRKAKTTIRVLMAISVAMILLIIFYPLCANTAMNDSSAIFGIGAFTVTALAETVLGIF